MLYLFKLESLVAPAIVDRGSPYLVRRLVFGAAETEGRAKPEIEVARILENVDQLFGIELRTGPLQGLDQDVGGDIAFERDVVRRLARKIFGKRVLVFEHGARIAAD